MNLFVIALITIRRGMGDRGDLSNLMPQLRVATRAFDFVVSDMFLMHKLRGILRSE